MNIDQETVAVIISCAAMLLSFRPISFIARIIDKRKNRLQRHEIAIRQFERRDREQSERLAEAHRTIAALQAEGRATPNEARRFVETATYDGRFAVGQRVDAIGKVDPRINTITCKTEDRA